MRFQRCDGNTKAIIFQFLALVFPSHRWNEKEEWVNHKSYYYQLIIM